jgi:hypothetical protein
MEVFIAVSWVIFGLAHACGLSGLIYLWVTPAVTNAKNRLQEGLLDHEVKPEETA